MICQTGLPEKHHQAPSGRQDGRPCVMHSCGVNAVPFAVVVAIWWLTMSSRFTSRPTLSLSIRISSHYAKRNGTASTAICFSVILATGGELTRLYWPMWHIGISGLLRTDSMDSHCFTCGTVIIWSDSDQCYICPKCKEDNASKQ